MKLQLEKNDWKWFKLRRRLFEDKRCERQEKSKAAIFAALAGRWRDRGISGSSRDWWTRYPNELFDSDFYFALVKFRRERREGSLVLDRAFRAILGMSPPQGFLRCFWLMHGGGHKIYLLKALLGPEEYDRQAGPNHWALLSKTDWNPVDYFRSSVDEKKANSLSHLSKSDSRASEALDVVAQLTPVMLLSAGMTGSPIDDLPEDGCVPRPLSRVLKEPRNSGAGGKRS